MKKILSLILMLACAFTCTFALASCGDTECTAHVDADKDGICDTEGCGAAVAPECTDHVDADKDGVCDTEGCDETVAPPPCTNHVDADKDGVCDSEGCDEAVIPTYTEAAAAFITAYSSATVNNYITTIEVDFGEGVLLNAQYMYIKNTNGTATIVYMYEQSTGLDVAEDKAIVQGTIVSDAEGNFTDDPHGVAKNLGATGIKLDIDNAAITDYIVSEYTLGINVKQADTAAVLGAALPSDAVVSVQLEGTALASISLSYTDADGNAVRMLSYINYSFGA
ncbi:MAG: hypothetical protein IJD51_03840 [Clostridia bacterium]|nr:hypothetical protein [Clostridia bacterium]